MKLNPENSSVFQWIVTILSKAINDYKILVLLLAKEQDVALSIFDLLLKSYKFYKENYNTS